MMSTEVKNKSKILKSLQIKQFRNHSNTFQKYTQSQIIAKNKINFSPGEHITNMQPGSIISDSSDDIHNKKNTVDQQLNTITQIS